jgi:hypothetical protein
MTLTVLIKHIGYSSLKVVQFQMLFSGGGMFLMKTELQACANPQRAYTEVIRQGTSRKICLSTYQISLWGSPLINYDRRGFF